MSTPAASASGLPILNGIAEGPVTVPAGGRSIAPTFSTQSTLFLPNNSLERGNVLSPSFNIPRFTVYDPITYLIYISDGTNQILKVDPGRSTVVGVLNAYGPAGNLLFLPATGDLYIESSGNVTILQPANDTLVATIPVATASPGEDGTLIYVPPENALWITNPFSSTLDVVGLDQRAVIHSLGVGGGFNDILSGGYDPIHGKVDLVYYENDVVEVLNASTYAYVQNVSLTFHCCFATGMGVDPLTGNIYVVDGLHAAYFGFYVDELSGANGSLITSRSAGAYPSNIAYDAATNVIYLADSLASYIYSFNPSNLSLLHQIPLPSQFAFLADQWWPVDVPQLDRIYVATGYGETLDSVSTQNYTEVQSIVLQSRLNLVTFDGSCGCDVVADNNRNLLYFVDPRNLSVTATVPLAGQPYGMAWDNRSGDLFVTLSGFFGTHGIQVLNGTTGQSIKILGDSNGPWGVVYDPANDQVFVADYFGNHVSVFAGSNLTLVATIQTGNQTTGLVYVPTNGNIYATNWGTHNVSVINGLTDTVTTSVHIGGAPVNIGFDPVSGLVYVGNYANLNTSILNVSQNAVVGSLNVSYAEGFATDPNTGDLYIMNGTSSISQVNTTTNLVTEIRAGLSTSDAVWQAGLGLLVTDGGSGALYVVGNRSTSLIYNVSLTASPLVGAVGAPLTLITSAKGGQGPLTFQYSGLPRGCGTANRSQLVCRPQVAGQFQVTVRVSDGSSRTVESSTTVWVTAPYRVTAYEAGLPVNTWWYLNLSDGRSFSTNGTTISFSAANGTLTYTLASGNASFRGEGGLFSVAGAAVSLYVSFVPSIFSVQLLESGLPAGTLWFVSVTGGPQYSTANASIRFFLANGTYILTFASSNTSWNASASGATIAGQPLQLSVNFRLVEFRVDVSESGLPSRTLWWFNLTGTGISVASTAPGSRLNLPNGSYAFVAQASINQWRAATGEFLIRGSGSSVNVQFVLLTYLQRFAQSGLSAGQSWTLSVNGEPAEISAGSEIDLLLPNGTYPYSVVAPPGFNVTPAPGVLVVRGSPSTVSLTFSPATGAVSLPSIASFEALPNTLTVGDRLAFLTGVKGGVAPLRYTYSGLPPGCTSSDTPELFCQPSAGGTYTVAVTVSDAMGRMATDQLEVTVTGRSTAVQPVLPGILLWLPVTGGIGAAIGAAVLFAVRRRDPSLPGRAKARTTGSDATPSDRSEQADASRGATGDREARVDETKEV